MHGLALRFDAAQSEDAEREEARRTLRQVEAAVQGMATGDLTGRGRRLLRHDLVATAAGGGGSGGGCGGGPRKDRCLFLFDDLLVITTVGKRAVRDVRRGSA